MRTNITLFVWAATLLTFAEGQSNRTISVTGQGTVTASPDVATINSGVTTSAETAQAALDENSVTMNEIFSVLTSYNIADKDIQTTSFQVNGDYNYTASPPELVGYSVSNTVNVNVRNLDVLGQLLDALVAAGSNQVGGISFGFNNSTQLTRTAMTNAVTDAESRARLYANAAGVTLGKILSMQESGSVVDQPLSSADGAFAPIASGEQGISASIQVVYEVVDASSE